MSEELHDTAVAAETEVPAEATSAQAEDPAAPAPKKKSRKKLAIWSGVAVLVAAAGIGFYVWHNQPSFCDAICHTPMDPYGDTYFQELGAPGVDKWGNQVANTSGMLCVVHAAEGLGCIDCHVPTLSEQIHEGIEWVTGNYTAYENPTYGLVISEKNLTQLVAARGLESGDEFCLTEGCHETDRKGLIALTMDVSRVRNPHAMPHRELQCSDCHKSHRASINQCSACHDDAPIPEGWLTTAEAAKLAEKVL